VETWQVGANDLVLVASREQRAYDAARLRERLAQPSIRTGMRAVWGVRDLEGFLAFFVARDRLAHALSRRGEINTDDRNVVEFGFARTLGRRSLLALVQLRQAAADRAEDRPGVAGEVDWQRVAAARMVFYPRAEMAPRLWEGLAPELKALGSFHERSLANDPRGAVAAWQAVGREPWSDTEEKLLAQALAELGDPQALALAEARRADWPLEADALVAVLRYRQGRLDEATEALEKALSALRTDAWSDLALLRRAVVLAGALASSDSARAARLYPVLRHRFSLALFEDQRLVALAQALQSLQSGPECLGVMAELEPNVPWLADWLALRSQCYAGAGSPLAGQAAADLEAFRRGEPLRFDVGLGKQH
jgi:tetratricopeptide (TPR) repeat protein